MDAEKKIEQAAEVALEAGTRIAKGHLNGTTRRKAYGLLAATALTGVVAGVVTTVSFLKRRYTFEQRFVKVPREH